MGTRDLPDVYAQTLRTTDPKGEDIQSGKLQVYMHDKTNMYHFHSTGT